MIDEDYASERSKFINYTKAAIGVPPGQFPGWNVTADYNPFDSMTTHYSIIDKYDNMIACSTTLMGFWGSGIMVRGFLLNNRLSNFPANSTDGITPGRRLRKTALPPWNSTYGACRTGSYLLTPTIALKNGVPYLTLGTPGSNYIPGNTFTTLLKILYWNMSLTDAILSPRLNSFNDGIWLIEDNDVFNNTELELDFAQVGITMKYLQGLSAIGDINAVQQFEDGTVDAFADPRRDGYAEVA
jgi:gamma-glutamyltranspeptidase/glutathione hydrolase